MGYQGFSPVWVSISGGGGVGGRGWVTSRILRCRGRGPGDVCRVAVVNFRAKSVMFRFRGRFFLSVRGFFSPCGLFVVRAVLFAVRARFLPSVRCFFLSVRAFCDPGGFFAVRAALFAVHAVFFQLRGSFLRAGRWGSVKSGSRALRCGSLRRWPRPAFAGGFRRRLAGDRGRSVCAGGFRGLPRDRFPGRNGRRDRAARRGE